MTPAKRHRLTRAFTLAVAAALLPTALVMVIVGNYAAAIVDVGMALVILSALSLEGLAYRAGYLRARAQMFGSLQEAMQRGLTFEEWVVAELERD